MRRTLSGLGEQRVPLVHSRQLAVGWRAAAVWGRRKCSIGRNSTGTWSEALETAVGGTFTLSIRFGGDYNAWWNWCSGRFEQQRFTPPFSALHVGLSRAGPPHLPPSRSSTALSANMTLVVAHCESMKHRELLCRPEHGARATRNAAHTESCCNRTAGRCEQASSSDVKLANFGSMLLTHADEGKRVWCQLRKCCIWRGRVTPSAKTPPKRCQDQ